MSDYERTILEHYHLTTPYPVEWPAEKDNSDSSDEEREEKVEAPRSQASPRRKRSKFSALEQVASNRMGRSLVPGSQKTGAGVENLVQRDEPDPLGSTQSVVRVLEQRGLPIQGDSELR
jgi:exocyst complex component 2